MVVGYFLFAVVFLIFAFMIFSRTNSYPFSEKITNEGRYIVDGYNIILGDAGSGRLGTATSDGYTQTIYLKSNETVLSMLSTCNHEMCHLANPEKPNEFKCYAEEVVRIVTNNNYDVCDKFIEMIK